MNDNESKTHTFLAVWDCLGLEYLCDLTVSEQEQIVSTLRGDEQPKPSNPLLYFLLRARLNTQRHYEIYRFDSELDESEIIEMFQEDPQTIVDNIRQVGVCLYSDREDSTRVVIR